MGTKHDDPYYSKDRLGIKQLRKALVATTRLKEVCKNFRNRFYELIKDFLPFFSLVSNVSTLHVDEETLGYFFILCLCVVLLSLNM